jgi:hypothetical protein
LREGSELGGAAAGAGMIVKSGRKSAHIGQNAYFDQYDVGKRLQVADSA